VNVKHEGMKQLHIILLDWNTVNEKTPYIFAVGTCRNRSCNSLLWLSKDSTTLHSSQNFSVTFMPTMWSVDQKESGRNRSSRSTIQPSCCFM